MKYDGFCVHQLIQLFLSWNVSLRTLQKESTNLLRTELQNKQFLEHCKLFLYLKKSPLVWVNYHFG